MFTKHFYPLLFIFATPALALAQPQPGAFMNPSDTASVPIVQVKPGGGLTQPPPPPPISAPIATGRTASGAVASAQSPAPASGSGRPVILTGSQAPASTIPAENPNTPRIMGGGTPAGPVVALPPHVPQFMPSGAPNLDWNWTEDGGARPYWNDVLIPQQLRMDGAYWVDPALVPQLLPDKSATPRRRYYRPRARIKSKAPANAASTALKSPAIPVPVTPDKKAEPAQQSTTETDTIPPLTASGAKATPPRRSPSRINGNPATPSAEDITITPPPLQ